MDTTTSSRLRFAPRHLVLALLLASGAPLIARAGDAPVETASTPAATLAPGEYEWTPERSTSGPLVILVSLPQQMAHVYRGGVRIGRSTISSGKPGHETPTGVYPILQKRRVHHSNLYNNAPMPFMQRLTWDGIALHAGQIPGHPASHGCVRLPHAFAEKLFEVTERDVNVVIADETTHGLAVLDPGDRVPVDPWTGREAGATGLASAGTPHGEGTSGLSARAGR